MRPACVAAGGRDVREGHMAGVILKLNQMINDFPPSERKAADYISKHLDDAVGLSVEELACRSGSSKAAVIRFCKSLGCKGYRDLAIQLAAELAVNQNNADADEYIDINVGDDVETIIRNVSYHNMKAVEDTLSLVDAGLVREAAEKLFQAERIDFYGIGASGIVAQDAQYKFMRINKFATAYTDSHLQLTAAANLGGTGVAVAISWSGETRDVVEAARLAKKSGALVIAVTRYGQTTLGECADIHFRLSAPEATIRCGAMSSRIAQLSMIDMLYSCIVSQNYHAVKKYLESTRTEVKKKRGV